jgi:hypothetical protein
VRKNSTSKAESSSQNLTAHKSPSSAGLIPYGDYVVGWTEGALHAESDFYDLVEHVRLRIPCSIVLYGLAETVPPGCSHSAYRQTSATLRVFIGSRVSHGTRHVKANGMRGGVLTSCLVRLLVICGRSCWYRIGNGVGAVSSGVELGKHGSKHDMGM